MGSFQFAVNMRFTAFPLLNSYWLSILYWDSLFATSCCGKCLFRFRFFIARLIYFFISKGRKKKDVKHLAVIRFLVSMYSLFVTVLLCL